MRNAITQIFHAYADESGDRGVSDKSSTHFVLAAAVFRANDSANATALLAQLRSDLGRRPEDPLSWKNIKGHAPRLHIATTLGAADWLTAIAVVACKRHLTPLPRPDLSYMYTFRFLLERLSWLARDQAGVMDCTLAHIKGFKLETLREYEHRLQADPATNINWPAIPSPTQIDQPNRREMLQLADLVASATAQAFNLDEFGNTERRYLERLAPRLYRRPPGALASYGLKMHPWSEATKALYPMGEYALDKKRARRPAYPLFCGADVAAG